MTTFLHELKRRNVIRVATAYVVLSWLLIQVAETIFPLFGLGDAPARLVVIILAIGFIPVLVVSWVFELTPEGFRRESDIGLEESDAQHSGKRLDRIIMVALALALGYFAFDKFILDPRRDAEIARTAEQSGAEQAMEAVRLGMVSEKSIAVLPFDNRSELKENEYFTDGMHDELLTRLSRIADLKVISRTSVVQYRGTDLSIPEIGKALAVATILEGGIQRSGNTIRVNVQLIDARTDEHLWAEIYDRELTAENLFSIQTEISTTIADALKAELSPAENALVADKPTFSLEAYDHYLKGRQLFANRGVSDLKQALVHYRASVDLDPDFALAWVGIGDTDHLLKERLEADRAAHTEIHKQAVDRAMVLNDRLGEAYTSLSFYYLDVGQDEKARAALEKAIELNPNYSQAYHWLASSLPGPETKATSERRLALFYKAAELDPNSTVVQLNIAQVLQGLGRMQEYHEKLLHVLELDPGFAATYIQIGRIHVTHGQLAFATQWFQKAVELDPADSITWSTLVRAFVAFERTKEARNARIRAGQHLDPNNPWLRSMDFTLDMAELRFTESLERAEQYPARVRSSGDVQNYLSEVYLLAGNFEKALEHLRNANPNLADIEGIIEKLRSGKGARCSLAGILMGAGETGAGRQILDISRANLGLDGADPGELESSWSLVTCALLAGETSLALDHLDRLLTRDGFSLWWYMSKEPWWNEVREHPLYRQLQVRYEDWVAKQQVMFEAMQATEGLDLEFDLGS